MATFTITEGTRDALPPHLRAEDIALRTCTVHKSDGDVPGYLFCFRSNVGTFEEALSDWFFASNDHMEALIATLQRFVYSEGHLAEKNQPGPSVQ